MGVQPPSLGKSCIAIRLLRRNSDQRSTGCCKAASSDADYSGNLGQRACARHQRADIFRKPAQLQLSMDFYRRLSDGFYCSI